MIQERYCSFEVAKLLKEKGFRDNCASAYMTDGEVKDLLEDTVEWNNGLINWNSVSHDDLCYWGISGWDVECSRPTHQMAMDWLRETHNIDIDIEASVGMLGVKVYVPFISTYKPLKDAPSKVRQIKRGIYYKDDRGVIPALQYFDSYEEATETALKYCLTKLIK